MALAYQINGKELARRIEEGINNPSKRDLENCHVKSCCKFSKDMVRRLSAKLMALPTDEKNARSLKATPFDFEYATMEWFGFRSYTEGLYLPYSIFRNTELECANFHLWTFDHSDFTNSNLKGSYLKATKFINAKLRSAVLRGTNMITTRLDGADVDAVDFYHALLSGTFFCNNEGFGQPGYVANPARNLDKVKNLYYATRHNVILHPSQVEIWKKMAHDPNESALQILGRYKEFVEV